MHSIDLGQAALKYLNFALAEDFVFGNKDELFDNIKLCLDSFDLLCIGVNQEQVLRVGIADSVRHKRLEAHENEGLVWHLLRFVRFDLHAIQSQIQREH